MARIKKEESVAEVAETTEVVESSAGESVKPVEVKAEQVLPNRALGVVEVKGKGYTVAEVMFNPLTLESGSVKFITDFGPKSEAEMRFKIKAVELGVLGR